MNQAESYHIMLVEDSPTQATKMRYMLEDVGWRVTWAASPQEAFSKLAEGKPDLVLLDFYLPGMSGDEVCRRIRRHIDTRNMPVVMLTAEDTSAAELRGLDSGADDFIAKSVDSDVLILRLRTLLGKVNKQSEILAGHKAAFRSPKLLAIDDSKTFLARLEIELEGEGYEVETAEDPEEGVRRSVAGTFDAILIDLVMPKMDGFEVCRQIYARAKKDDFSPVTVILTGKDCKENQTRALEAGADDFVGKSSDVSILKGRIRALLRRKFFEQENRRILDELRQKELEAVKERAAKEAAEARAEIVEELEKIAAELRISQNALQRANEAKDKFLAVLSHELRTPLTPVLATVSMRLEDGHLSSEMKDELSMIRRNIELEARLIDDLLDVTRITSGKLEIRHEVVNMKQVIKDSIVISSPPDSRAIPIEVIHEASRDEVWGDGSRLTQVMSNLLRNAIKFTPADGKITIRCFNTGDLNNGLDFVAEVIDTGIGIEPDILPNIFNAFEQGSRRVTQEYGGLGLGLAISEAITEAHLGKLKAFSGGRNKGATFSLTLPVYISRREEAGTVDGDDGLNVQPQPARSVSGKSTLQSADGQSLRILLVEDHKDTAKAITMLLTRRGFDVQSQETVKSAVEASQQTEFDLLISDLSLPDGSGYDVLRQIREVQFIPAIALSGFGMDEDVQRSQNAGFATHLVKPVSVGGLSSAIQQIFPDYIKH